MNKISSNIDKLSLVSNTLRDAIIEYPDLKETLKLQLLNIKKIDNTLYNGIIVGDKNTVVDITSSKLYVSYFDNLLYFLLELKVPMLYNFYNEQLQKMILLENDLKLLIENYFIKNNKFFIDYILEYNVVKRVVYYNIDDNFRYWANYYNLTSLANIENYCKKSILDENISNYKMTNSKKFTIPLTIENHYNTMLDLVKNSIKLFIIPIKKNDEVLKNIINYTNFYLNEIENGNYDNYNNIVGLIKYSQSRNYNFLSLDKLKYLINF